MKVSAARAAAVAVAAAVVVALAAGCAADELDPELGSGACKDGKCAEGYDCVGGQCVPEGSSTGGSAGGGPVDAAEDGPCATCAESCCEDQCVDVLTSTAHCGSCGKACLGTICAGGTCTNDCAPGFFDCDGNKANGCEESAACG